MAEVKVVRRWGRRPVAAPPGPGPLPRPTAPRLVTIAASTGGPAALQRILSDLPGDFPVPILVVQHIARGFTEGLAAWLDAGSPLKVKLAEHREALAPRTVYVAPDDRQLAIGEGESLEVLDAPPVGGFRPSATRLFESAARRLGAAVVAVVLTGMGRDGTAGLEPIRSAGGYVIAQDRATSVVYGMPQAAVEAGLVDAVLPLDAIGPRLESLVRAGRRAIPAASGPRKEDWS